MVKSNMLTLSYDQNTADAIFIRSSEILKSRGIIAYPTESYYALGALATDEEAVRKLYGLKGRNADKPLPIIVGDMDTLRSVVRHIPLYAEDFIRNFWPGPLTLIFDAQDNIPDLLTGGRRKVAVRIPGESIALHLAMALRIPITSTSANQSGQPPADCPADIIKYFGNQIDLVIDGGKTPGGKPSTIVDVTVQPPEILREGSIVI